MASPAFAGAARRSYAERISGNYEGAPWWDAVVLTASSARQAERYTDEIERRRRESKIPQAVYLAVPDAGDRRIGSGGATLNALRALAPKLGRGWQDARVLIIHSGGDSRRLPQYSLSGKLFGALPVLTPWGEVSTVFDEFLALASAWAERLPSGLVVASGDVVLTFDPSELDWSRAGATGVALRQPPDVGSQHGVYVADDTGRVYTFLQKPSEAEVAGAGGILPGGLVAVDSGLIRFDPALTTELAALGASMGDNVPFMDLYRHFTMALTGQWRAPVDDHPVLQRLHSILAGQPFWCSVLDGNFTHVGTTQSFHRLVTEETQFSRLYEARQRLQVATPDGVRSAGVIIDSVLAPGSELGAASIAIECNLSVPATLGRRSIVHGACDVDTPIEAPEGVVVHQVPVALPDEWRAVVVRVYGVDDDPKSNLWFGRPLNEQLARRGIDPEAVWPGIPERERILWNAELFPAGTAAQAWQAARWLMGFVESAGYGAGSWLAARRMSLATSAHWAASRVRTAHSAHAGGVAADRGRTRARGFGHTTVACERSGCGGAGGGGPGGGKRSIARAEHLGDARREPPLSRVTVFRAGRIAGSRGPSTVGGVRVRAGSRECGRGGRRAMGRRARVDARSGGSGRAATHRLGGRMVRHASVLSRLGRHGLEHRGGVERGVPHSNAYPPSR